MILIKFKLSESSIQKISIVWLGFQNLTDTSWINGDAAFKFRVACKFKLPVVPSPMFRVKSARGGRSSWGRCCWAWTAKLEIILVGTEMNQSCSSKVRSQYEVEQNINLLCTGKSRLGSCHTQAGSGNLNRSAAVRVNGNQSPIACNFESAEICAERLWCAVDLCKNIFLDRQITFWCMMFSSWLRWLPFTLYLV